MTWLSMCCDIIIICASWLRTFLFRINLMSYNLVIIEIIGLLLWRKLIECIALLCRININANLDYGFPICLLRISCCLCFRSICCFVNFTALFLSILFPFARLLSFTYLCSSVFHFFFFLIGSFVIQPFVLPGVLFVFIFKKRLSLLVFDGLYPLNMPLYVKAVYNQ